MRCTRICLTMWLVVVAAVACLALPQPGWAARPASPDELAQMAAAAEFEPGCIASASVSTVNGAWGRLDPQPNLPNCPQGNGFFVMQFTPGSGWDVIWQGSEVFPCPAADVPDDVGADLNVCRKGKTFLLCLPKSEDLRVGRSKPSSCTTLGPQDAFCCAANLIKLHWKQWGKSQATATGYERGFHLPLQHIKAQVTAYGRKVGDCGDFVYTRLKVHTRYGTLRQKFPAQCADADG
jgi:hypothetical protein